MNLTTLAFPTSEAPVEAVPMVGLERSEPVTCHWMGRVHRRPVPPTARVGLKGGGGVASDVFEPESSWKPSRWTKAKPIANWPWLSTWLRSMSAAAVLAVRPVDFDDGHTGPEAAHPRQQPGVAVRGGKGSFGAQQATDPIQGSSDVDVGVGCRHRR